MQTPKRWLALLVSALALTIAAGGCERPPTRGQAATRAPDVAYEPTPHDVVAGGETLINYTFVMSGQERAEKFSLHFNAHPSVRVTDFRNIARAFRSRAHSYLSFTFDSINGIA